MLVNEWHCLSSIYQAKKAKCKVNPWLTMLVKDSRGQKVKCNVNLCLSLIPTARMSSGPWKTGGRGRYLSVHITKQDLSKDLFIVGICGGVHSSRDSWAAGHRITKCNANYASLCYVSWHECLVTLLVIDSLNPEVKYIVKFSHRFTKFL